MASASKAFIFGAGAQGRTVLDILRAAACYDHLAFVDDGPDLLGCSINGAQVFGNLADLAEVGKGSDKFLAGLVVALGRPQLRELVAGRIAEMIEKWPERLSFINALHPQAYVAASARIGLGNMIAAQSVVNSNACLGNHIIVNTAAVIEHDDQIDDFASICPGAQLGGRVTVGKAAFIGTGAVILPRVKIGEGAVVGAGSLVTRDVPEHTLVYGSPARVIRPIDKDFDFGRLL